MALWIVRRVHQSKSKLLGLFLGRPVGGQDLITRDGIDDDDVENPLRSYAHLPSARSLSLLKVATRELLAWELTSTNLGSHPFIY